MRHIIFVIIAILLFTGCGKPSSSSTTSSRTLGITVKGNARLKGQNYISVNTKNGSVTSVSVMTTTREGIIPVEGEKEKADQMFESLLRILKKQYGKPDHEGTVEGNGGAIWITDKVLISLEREFDWDNNIFSVKTDMELIPPGEADEMRKEMRKAFQSMKK